MSITRWMEICCDYCGCGISHSLGNKRQAEQELREDGGVVTADHHHFCDKKCCQKFRADGGKSRREEATPEHEKNHSV